MTRTPLLLALVAAGTLAACNKEDHTIVVGADNSANETVANSAPVELPPSITTSKIYRCKDNSVVYVDWLSDNKSVNFRPDQTAVPVRLVAPEAGQPMTANGTTVAGTAESSTITLTRPGKGSQSCKA
ncbi:MAG TPA: hypothetical protein VFP53_06690 [Sphingomicrobium sp.]|nr:hypothetical protein [Sphingomicrobium sp.]